jgi:hypothetical protein
VWIPCRKSTVLPHFDSSYGKGLWGRVVSLSKKNA